MRKKKVHTSTEEKEARMEQQSKKKHTGNGVRCYRIILGIALVVIIALAGWYMLSCSKNATPKEGTLVKSNCEYEGKA